MGRFVRAACLALAAVALAACDDTAIPAREAPPSSPDTGHVTTKESFAQPARGTVPPAWLGTRVLPLRADGFGEVRPTPPVLRNRRFTLPDAMPALSGGGFAARVQAPTDEVIARSTWEPGCPVDRFELAWVRVTFWGFDDERHTGELLANSAVADDLVDVFRTLYDARYPIEELRITRRDELDAPPTGDGNITGVFVCRPAVGSTTFSQHAYGLAIDVNSFQNPYVKGDLVLPELASAYLDRDRDRLGIIRPGDVVVNAFAGIGWEWGGDWQSLKDYQHFSLTGR